MAELISAAQAELLVTMAAVIVTIIGAAWGYFAAGKRGVLAALCGPLLWLLWQGHKWITRYDPQSGYFGLDKVWVLVVEVVVFVALGLALGALWNTIQNRGKFTAEDAESAENV